MGLSFGLPSFETTVYYNCVERAIKPQLTLHVGGMFQKVFVQLMVFSRSHDRITLVCYRPRSRER